MVTVIQIPHVIYMIIGCNYRLFLIIHLLILALFPFIVWLYLFIIILYYYTLFIILTIKQLIVLFIQGDK